MRVVGCERMYAVGDCVSLPGPKMGHMAVQQGEVAAQTIGHGRFWHWAKHVQQLYWQAQHS